MKLTLTKQLLTLFLALFMTQSFVHAEYLENAIPPAKAFDWMELQSGEWLKGEFKEIYSGDVVFDSDEMDVVTFSLDDVKQIITKGTSTISLEGQDEPVEGKMGFVNGQFKITKADGSIINVQSSQIASIAGGEDKESNYWSASASLGLEVMSGNSAQKTVTAKANVQRRSSDTRFIADYLGVFTQIDNNTTTANNNRAGASFDIYQTAHFYWRVAALEFLRDPFQNIARKYTYAAGLGYDIIYTPRTNWSITVGPGYQTTTFYAVDANTSDTADTALFFLDSRFDVEVTNDIDFIFNYNVYLLNEASGSYIHHAVTTLETEMISDLVFDISVIWDRTEDPIPFANGTAPQQDDYKTILSLGYSY